ncbi:hypothetical protein M9Y10_026356 [Tritrichomonas musculus]|uniref:Leucine-rich repeat domain-containing protein n=1 Tax=Tritrichomonas musculus TaxID=1915356 RepID=A0ABR2H7C3_9EUKA
MEKQKLASLKQHINNLLIEEIRSKLELEEEKRREIQKILTEYNEIDSIRRYEEIKEDIFDSIKNNDFELFETLLGAEVCNEEEAYFKINYKKKEAALFNDEPFNTLIIPRTIQHNGESYLVTRVIKCNYIQDTLQFEENSAVHTFYKDAFKYSNVVSIFLPENLREIKEGCFCGMNELRNIIISPSNDRFQYKDDKYLLCKTDEKSDNFDVILFARRDIEKAIIPSNIKVISKYAFYECQNLRKVIFEDNSELEIIGEKAFALSAIESICIPSSVSEISDNAFFYCSNLREVKFEENSKLEIIGEEVFGDSVIEEFFIPANLRKIKEGCFCGMDELKSITISPSNDRFQYKDDKYLLCKKDEKSDNFDVILFARRDIDEITIPSNIKIISKYAFSVPTIESICIPSSVSEISDNAFFYCSNLREVKFEENSKLEIIGEDAFYESPIEEFFIPANLRKIKEGCFCGMNELRNIIISPLNDRFQYKDNKYLLCKTDEKSDNFDVILFARRDIEEAIISSNIKIISQYAFYECENLRKVIFEDNSKLEIIGEYAFFSCKNLRKVIFDENSKLKSIGENAFTGTMIESIVIPKNVSKTSIYAFITKDNTRSTIKIVEIPEKSKLQPFIDYYFNFEIEILMIPRNINL